MMKLKNNNNNIIALIKNWQINEIISRTYFENDIMNSISLN